MNQIIFIFLLIVCLYPTATKSDYKVINKTITSTAVQLTLQYFGKQTYHIKPTSPIIKTLTFTLKMLSFNDFVFKIIDANKQRFQVPSGDKFPQDLIENNSFPLNSSAITFEFTENPFDFNITRKNNKGILFSTYNHDFIYSEHYMQIGSDINSHYMYGLGERFSNSFRKKQGRWTIFNRDRPGKVDHGTGLQTYGHYPFYLLRQDNDYFHINYLRNSNAMDVIRSGSVILKKHHIVYKVIGGVLDFRFFIAEKNPEDLLAKFHQFIGKSIIPPFWSLGAHQCRWGYENASVLQKVLDSYEKNKIPLDTIWSDIDYMNQKQDFTIDEKNFPLDQMKRITDKYHYIPIIDAGIKVNGSAYNEGIKKDLFIKDATGKQSFIGKVWPGSTAFVDFFHPNSTQYWADMLDILYQKVKFSGIWLDMNQISNFCQGPCTPPKEKTIFDYQKDLPYQPGNDSIQTQTIPLNSTHYGNLKEADVHVFFALLQNAATNHYLKNKNLRPFIISRSSTLGSNRFGFHWTGDNVATFEFLQISIWQNFNHQLWGFQMVGADVCGFAGDTNEQLCARWYQLGSLYPFFRNHNAINQKDQQPYALGSKVLEAAVNNIRLRYSMLKYYYSLFVRNRGQGGIFKPLFFTFPNDDNSYDDSISETQIMIGDSLMATPIVVQKKTDRSVYFPETKWYDLHTGKSHIAGFDIIENIQITDKVPLFLRENSLIFLQDVTNVLQTKQLSNKFTMTIGLKLNKSKSSSQLKIHEARGSFLSINDYNDDKLIDSCLVNGCDYSFEISLNETSGSLSLGVNVQYVGGVDLNQEIILNKIVLFYGTVTANKDLTSNPISVKGSKKFIIPMELLPVAIKQPQHSNLKKEENYHRFAYQSLTSSAQE